MTVAAAPSAAHATCRAGAFQVSARPCVRSNTAAQPCASGADRHRLHLGAFSCRAMTGNGASGFVDGNGARRRAAAVPHAMVKPGTVPGGNLPDEDDEAEAELLADPHSGHAFLHDFCMAIPYGLILVLAGLVSLFARGFNAGLALLGAGVMTEMLASLSLTNWKQEQDSRVYTVGSAGIALAITVTMWQKATTGLAAFLTKALSGVSGLMLLFLVYNVLAGGNPPKKNESAEKEEVVQVNINPQT